MSTKFIAFVAVIASTCFIMSCGEKKPAEKTSDAGKTVGQTVGAAARTAGDAVSDAAMATGDAVGDAATATSDAVSDAATATKDFAVDAGDALVRQKDESIKVAKETIATLEKKWQEMVGKAEPTTDAAKADFQKAKDQMAQTFADAKEKLGEAQDAGSDAWQKNVKPVIDASIQKAQEIYQDIAARFSSD